MVTDLSPLWISLKTAVVATLLASVAGIETARWMLRYQGKAKGLIDGLLTLPIVLPPTVIGFLLLFLLGRQSPIGQMLERVGVTLILSWPAAVIASTVVAFPLMYKTVLGAFEQIEPDLIGCARTLGASEARIFWQVILPLAWPGAVAGTILAFARALGEFGATLMVAGSIPGRTQTMPIAIYFAAEAGQTQVALFWVAVMVGIALFAIALINYWSNFRNVAQSPTLRRVSVWLNRGAVILNRWLTQCAPVQPYESSVPLTVAPPGQETSSLDVNLYRHLPGFTLTTQFKTNGTPLGILGASGAGKSMTLRCIAGLTIPDKGRIVLNGQVLFDAQQGIDRPSRQRRIGYVFQNYALFPHMRVAQNIGFGLSALPKAERKQRVTQFIELMQLQGLEKRYPHELSGGQQQRVALARALAIAPAALLLDEPLSALDNHLRAQMTELLTQVFATYQGPVLLVTHRLEDAYRICDQLLVLDQGAVIAAGPKQDIFERPPTYTVAQLTECKNFSQVQVLGDQVIQAIDWDCPLQIATSSGAPPAYVGIRAHHLQFVTDSTPPNTFACWLANYSETQHRMTLYLKLNSPATSNQDYHLQAELYKVQWAQLKGKTWPWYLHLAPERLILMEAE